MLDAALLAFIALGCPFRQETIFMGMWSSDLTRTRSGMSWAGS